LSRRVPKLALRRTAGNEFEIEPVPVRHDYPSVGQKVAGVLEQDDAIA
jgi:hypothetical protein